MAFDFPASPTVGQPFAQGNIVYTWDGEKWVAGQLPNTGAAIEVGDTPPPAPTDKTLWYESDSGRLFLRYNDGNSTQWIQVTSPGVTDCPQDGGEYVRVNGIWRLRSQTFDLAGKSQQDLLVPAWGPKHARIVVSAQNAASCSLALRLSVDGTTYIAGASAYYTAGFYHRSGGTAPGIDISPEATAAQWILTASANHANIPLKCDTLVALTRGATSQYFALQGWGTSYLTNAGYLWLTAFVNGYADPTVFSGALALKGLRVFPTTGTFTHGFLSVEWMA